MTKPRPGLQAMVNQHAVEFLFLIRKEAFDLEIWRVRPLFVDEPEREERVIHNARITPIHTQRP